MFFTVCMSVCTLQCVNYCGRKWAVWCFFQIPWHIEGDGLNQHWHSFTKLLGSCSQPCDNTLRALVTEWASSCSAVGCFVFCLHLHFVRGILALEKEFLLGLKEMAKPQWGWLQSWGNERMQLENETYLGTSALHVHHLHWLPHLE